MDGDEEADWQNLSFGVMVVWVVWLYLYSRSRWVSSRLSADFKFDADLSKHRNIIRKSYLEKLACFGSQICVTFV